MTTAEKLTMVHGTATGIISAPATYAGTTAAIPRLCLPAVTLADGPAGVGDGMSGVTQLPAPIALAATWDPAAARAYGAVVGAEARGKGITVLLGPTVNIVRDPRWGRAFESFGEDPALTSELGVAYIHGIQSHGVLAAVKHYAAYNQETNRDAASDNAIVSDRVLREIYLPAFAAAVHDAHVSSVMCAYSTVNGVSSCANPYLLDQVLKGEWGFGGFVVSDWFARLGGPGAATAGLDLQMPDGCFFGPALATAIEQQEIATSRLDAMVTRILTPLFRHGLIDHRLKGTASTPVATAQHAAVARRLAAEGTVLLRNDGVLPLDATRLHSLAVISYGDTKTLSAGQGSAHVVASSVVSPADAIAARAGAAVRVSVDASGDPIRAAATATGADVAVVVVGRPSSESHDHTTLDLSDADNRLVDATAAANPRTIVVLDTPAAVTMPWLDHVSAVVEAWYPGEEDGHSLADVLFGDVDPSGRLPITFPTAISQMPTASGAQWPGEGEAVRYREGLDVGYRGYDARGETPLFPFGFGLSYTTFAYGRPTITGPTSTGTVTVTVRVGNTGARAGATVAQLYLSEPPTAGEPPRELRAFRRVQVAPARSRTVRFTLDTRALSYWSPAAHGWRADAGRYTVYVGNSSADVARPVDFALDRAITHAVATPPPPAQPTSSIDDAAARCPLDTGAPVGNGVISTPVTP